ncbi:MAG: hypothetical protein COA43_09995 [Robiginitomaculum sp.]|nr:MAG: hypothetical protein COA43_09995 [Robiginitomaculum sp.]
MAKKPKKNTTGLTRAQIKERTEAHPLAVPFLWLGKEKIIKNFIFVPLFGLIFFSLLGFKYPLHHPASWDFAFSYTLIGFAAYSFVVLMAWPLFKLLARDENYYGEEDND